MESPNALVVAVDEPIAVRPAAILKGTARGLEALVDGSAPIDAITAALTSRIEEAPGFFRGSDVRVRVEDGPLAVGSLARLEEVASRFELRIVEVSAAKKAADADAVPRPSFAAGTAPAAAPTSTTVSIATPATPVATVESASQPVVATQADPELASLMTMLDKPAPSVPAATAAPAPAPTPVAATDIEPELEAAVPGARLVIGPVRSGVILEHRGHLVIFGDVNPGAEVRAEGNIVVLGRLRGTAHAGIGRDVGFILALRLEPQQLRIGRRVARAADSDTPANDAEIAYCTGDAIVVERYLGKLPKNLATSI
jgi:septum site-determining protein MinC